MLTSDRRRELYNLQLDRGVGSFMGHSPAEMRQEPNSCSMSFSATISELDSTLPVGIKVLIYIFCDSIVPSRGNNEAAMISFVSLGCYARLVQEILTTLLANCNGDVACTIDAQVVDEVYNRYTKRCFIFPH